MRGAPVAASGAGATAAAVELRYGFLALSHAAAHRPAVVAAHAVGADARGAAPAHDAYLTQEQACGDGFAVGGARKRQIVYEAVLLDATTEGLL